MSTEITVPELGESIVEATVSRWLKQEGDAVAAGEALVELETDKVNLEVTAEKAGVLTSISRQAGEDVEIGDVLGTIDESAEGPINGRPASTTAGHQTETVSKPKTGDDEKATPVAKRLAQEHGLDLAAVGSPSGERITKEDVERYLTEEQKAPPPTKDKTDVPRKETTPKATRPSAPVDQTGRETRQRMSRRRQTIARRLVEAQQTAAMLTTFNEIDMGAVINLRQRRRETFQQRHGVRLGFMSFFVKAAIGALKQFPRLNAEIDGDDIVLKHYYDIGMAVGAEEGLVVPVIREADRLTFAEIEQTIASYIDKAQSGNLSIADLRGGTFTITNGGVFGSLLSTPILNPPQVGILGLHKIEQRPVARNDEIVIRPMMYVALSYDHRMVDGAEAVQFLVRVKDLIEDPEVLLLEG